MTLKKGFAPVPQVWQLAAVVRGTLAGRRARAEGAVDLLPELNRLLAEALAAYTAALAIRGSRPSRHPH